MSKNNDWFVLGITNPEASTSDFLISGINLNNTQFLSREDYKKSKFVLDKFTRNGEFDNNAFNDYYNYRAYEFNILYNLNIDDTFKYDPFDPRAKLLGKLVNDPSFNFETVANTARATTTFTGDIYLSDTSMREKALSNNIRNSATGEWSKDTLQDRTLEASPKKWFLSIFDKPLIYATYDSDGTHYDQFTGSMVEHKKGDYKINNKGLPYVETSEGQSLIGKEVVSLGDYLTIDGSKANNYDFIDSDGLDKSVVGTIAKTATALAPILIPYVGSVYAGAYVAKEITSSLPMLYGLMSPWLDMPEENKTINNLAAHARKFNSSISDAGKESFFNVENIGNLVTDVVLLFGLQRAIIKGLNLVTGTKALMANALKKAYITYNALREALKQELSPSNFEKYFGTVEKWNESIVGKSALEHFTKEIEPIVLMSNRVGANLALGYMSIVSNTDVYDAMIEAGASRKEAAAVSLGSILGMYAVDRYAHIGELFYDDLTAESTALIRRVFDKTSKSWSRELFNAGNTPEAKAKGIKGWIKRGIDFGTKLTNQYLEDLKYHSTGFWGKALGEGLEEVSEELIADLSKGTYELLGALGYDTSVKKVGAFENMLERYGSSFFGGALGGSLFYGIDLVQNGKFQLDRTLDEIEYLIRNGRTEELLKELEKWNKEGKLGNVNLSIHTDVNTNDGSITFLTANNKSESLNDFIYNRIKETILLLDNIINANDAKLGEDDLYLKLILSEARFRDLEAYLLKQKEDFNLQEYSYTTGYQRDYLNALTSVINLETELKLANTTRSGVYNPNNTNDIATDEWLRNAPESEIALRNDNLNKLEKKLQEAKNHLQRFISGEYSIDYIEKMLFALDPKINNEFIAMTFDLWLYHYHNGKTYKDLSPSEFETLKSDYLLYKEHALKEQLDKQFELWKAIKDRVNPFLLTLKENEDKFIESTLELSKLFNEDSPLANFKLYEVDDILDFEGETELSDSYINRKNNIERNDRISRKNEELLNLLKDLIISIIDNAGGNIDPITRRKLKFFLKNRNKDLYDNIVKRTISNYFGNIPFDSLDESILNILLASTIDTTSESLLNLIKEVIKNHLSQLIKKLNSARNHFLEYLVGELNYNIKSDLKEFLELNSVDISDNNETLLSWLDEGELDLVLELIDKEAINNNAEVSDDEINSLLNQYRGLIEILLDNVNSNPIISLNRELDSRVSKINPLIDLIKSIGLSLNIDMDNIEKVLNHIDERYESIKDVKDLILDSKEKETFIDAANLIKLTLAYISASSDVYHFIDPFTNPFTHNSLLNSIAENHKDIYKDWKPLPVLSLSLGETFKSGLNDYLLLLGVINPDGTYNAGSYLAMSYLNEADKALKYIRGEKALYKTLYDLFTKNRKAFKINDDIDLLEGIDDVPEVTEDSNDGLVNINKIFTLYTNNTKKALSSGISFITILEHLKDLVPNSKEVLLLKTSKLNDALTEDNLTAYDKIIIPVSLIGMDQNKFYAYLRKRIEDKNNIVPLTILEWISQLGINYIENSDYINQTLHYFAQESGDNRVVLDNIFFINGKGGAGKSEVVAGNLANYNKINKIWLSANATTLIKTLSRAVGKGEQMLNLIETTNGSNISKSLLDRLGINVNAYNTALEQLQGGQEESDYYTISEEGGSKVVNINIDKFEMHPIDDVPDVIIIDESTHLNPIFLQLLSHFTKTNTKDNKSPKVFLLGNDMQAGYTQLGGNIEREFVICARSPELGISLRDNNVQHSRNLEETEALLALVLDADMEDPEYNSKISDIRSKIPNLRPLVYKSTDINGELIIDSLTDDIINLIPKKNNKDELTTIGYVGVDDTIISKLESFGFNVISLSSNDIQGLEFDYVIVNKDFKYDLFKDNEMINFLRDYYTMISRSYNGTILIDPTHTLRNMVGDNRVETMLAKSPSILLYIDKFTENKLEQIDTILKDSSKENTTELPEDNKIEEKSEEEITGDYITEPNPEDSSNPLSPDFTKEDSFIVEEDSDVEELEIEVLVELAEDIKVSMMGFGNLTLTSMKREWVEENGKKRYVYKTPSNYDSKVKKDLQIFGEEFLDDLDLLNAFNKLLDLKNFFLFKKEYDKEILGNIMSKEAFNNIKWRIEIREKNEESDNLIRNIGVDEVIGLTDKQLIFSVVGEFEMKDGSKGEITLGLLGNPQTAKNNYKNLINKYEKAITKFSEQLEKASAEESLILNNKIQLLKEAQESLRNQIDTYEQWVLELARIFSGRTITYDVTSAISFDGMSRILKRKVPLRVYRIEPHIIEAMKEDLKHMEIEMNGLDISRGKSEEYLYWKERAEKLKQKIEEFEQIRTHSLMSLSVNNSVSPLYVVTSDGESLSISKKLKGRAVIFLSADKSLKGNNLAELYILQKRSLRQSASTKTQDVTPSVRMLVLNNIGISFLDLANPYLKDAMKSEVKAGDTTITNIVPFKLGVTGARMYVGLWNFRANLIRFLNLLLEFIEKHFANNLEELQKVLNYQRIQYKVDNKTATKEELEIYNNNNKFIEYQEKFKLIDTFNNEQLNKSVKQFRLGASDKNGAHIQKLQGMLNTSYYAPDKTYFGIYIDPNTTEKYLNILESLFTTLLDPIVLVNDNFNKDSLISLKEGYKNSLSGNIMSFLDNASITIQDIYNGNTLTISFEPVYDKDLGLTSAFSHVPIVLSKFFKYSRMILNSYNGFIPDFNNSNNPMNITLKWKSDNKKKELNLDYSDLLRIANIIDSEGKRIKYPDNTLSNLFSFAFHGTVDDFTKSDVIKSSDALFPNGFYVDPMADSGKNAKIVTGFDGTTQFKLIVLNGWFYSSDAIVTAPAFYINFNKIETLVNSPIVNNSEKIRLDILKEYSINYPELTEVFDKIKKHKKWNSYTEEDIRKKCNILLLEYVEGTTTLLFSNQNLDNIPSNTLIFDILDNGDKVIRRISDLVTGNIQKVSVSNNKLIILTEDNGIESVIEFTRVQGKLLRNNSAKEVTSEGLKNTLDKVINILNNYEDIKLIKGLISTIQSRFINTDNISLDSIERLKNNIKNNSKFIRETDMNEINELFNNLKC